MRSRAARPRAIQARSARKRRVVIQPVSSARTGAAGEQGEQAGLGEIHGSAVMRIVAVSRGRASNASAVQANGWKRSW